MQCYRGSRTVIPRNFELCVYLLYQSAFHKKSKKCNCLRKNNIKCWKREIFVFSGLRLSFLFLTFRKLSIFFIPPKNCFWKTSPSVLNLFKCSLWPYVIDTDFQSPRTLIFIWTMRMRMKTIKAFYYFTWEQKILHLNVFYILELRKKINWHSVFEVANKACILCEWRDWEW